MGGSLILDVGSGGKPFRFKGGEVVHVDVLRAEDVEVVCDAHHLPFKDKCFSLVHASHVIEHLKYPLDAVKEFERVCRGTVIIKVPNAKCDFAYEHLYSWNKKTLETFLKQAFKEVKVYPSVRVTPYKKPFLKLLSRAKTFVVIGLFGPNELTAACKT